MVETVEEKKEVKKIRPQEGFQEEFLTSDADIVIGGGGAGGGKSYALLFKPLYYIDDPKFRCTIFRRNRVQVKNAGGLWDDSKDLYKDLIPSLSVNETELEYKAPCGAEINFAHLEYDKNAKSYQGAQISILGFDELPHFSSYQFFYLLTRNRSMFKGKCQVLATCNPEPDSWVAKFIDWWIGEDGFPIAERDGVLRYFYKKDKSMDSIVWGDTKEEVYLKCKNELDELAANRKGKSDPYALIKSLTFIRGDVDDNQILLDSQPGYKGSIAQSAEDKHRLLKGNWRRSAETEALVSYDTMDKMFSRYPQKNGRRCISCDVAGKGSDRMWVKVWDGFHLMDFIVVARSDGKQIVDAILGMMRRYHISARDVVFDANNVGSHIDGFIPNSVEYKSQAQPLNGEYYFNLKAQCSQRWADRMNGTLIGNTENDKLQYSIDRSLTDRVVDGKTLYEHYQHERKAIRLDPVSVDGKPRIIKKSQMIAILGNSPDTVETDIMLELLYLSQTEFNGDLIW